MHADLTELLADLDRRGLLTHVAEPVSPDFEIAALTDRACKMPGGGPALVFDKPIGFDMPVASNVFGSVERMCLALGVKTLDDLAIEINQLLAPQVPEGIVDALKMLPLVGRLRDLMPKTVRDAPCQEVVRHDGTLDGLPILKCWPEDGGRFITLPLVFTKDPETDVRNIGTYRMQVFDGRTTGMHWQRHKGGAQHYRVAERLRRRLDVAVALSAEPVLTYCATAPMPEGLDDLKVRRPMSLDKAMEEDTLVAYAMNGQPLPADHGFPARLITPGWIGVANVKWVGRVQVSEEPLFSQWNTDTYVLIGPDYKPSAPAKGPILSLQSVKSALELPWGGEIAAGRRLLRGRSWSPEGKIERVEFSLDQGKSWQRARLREPNIARAWVRWDGDWDARAGKHRIRVRAADERGRSQPERVAFNEQGYLYNAIVDHPITVK